MLRSKARFAPKLRCPPNSSQGPIAADEPAADLPYLADVADVDWRLHRAYLAADADTVDSSMLIALGPERFAAASIRLAPSVELARSARWPIADILEMHASGATAHLGAGGQSVLIWRECFAVRWQRLGAREAEAIAVTDGRHCSRDGIRAFRCRR